MYEDTRASPPKSPHLHGRQRHKRLKAVYFMACYRSRGIPVARRLGLEQFNPHTPAAMKLAPSHRVGARLSLAPCIMPVLVTGIPVICEQITVVGTSQKTIRTRHPATTWMAVTSTAMTESAVGNP